MRNFSYQNSTRIVFGKGSIAELPSLIPPRARILMTFGGGSIKRNGVYDQVKAALAGRRMIEFGGIEPNPRYETLMKAVELARAEKSDFLLAVGGGSVLDGTKFIAAAIPFKGGDPWDILAGGAAVASAVPLGSVLTLAATGSEMNTYAVISRESTGEKLAFGSPHCLPRFSVLDPETNFSLPPRQTANGIVDAFAHTLEQYMTYDVNTPLQDRMAEGIFLTLIEEGPKLLKNPCDYEARANVMWSATLALNGLIACGAQEDWATHMIGHELTALYGLDHGQTLAVVFPAMMRFKREQKGAKLAQYAARVWGIKKGDAAARIDQAIDKTEAFFRSLGVGTRLSDYGVKKGLKRVGQRLEARGAVLGEHQDIRRREVDAILALGRE